MASVIHRLVVSAAALLLAACATPARYQPMDDDVGYGEQKLEANRYRVWFAGNSATPRETVEDYVLYRAAELTLADGYDYFVMSERATDAREVTSHGVSLGIGGFRFGRRSGVSIGLGTGIGLGGRDEFYGQADIVMMKGRKPKDDPSAFDARELKANLEPAILRPAAD